jgi:ElaB/YqjD/DUF883 family membrane-anchored ribosome-binding protein
LVADPVLSRELSALREEVTVSRREPAQPADARQMGPAMPTTSAAMAQTAQAAAPVDPVQETVEDPQLPGELQELFKEISEFLDSAEKNVSEHPAASMAAAMVLGILIGLLLGRR